MTSQPDETPPCLSSPPDFDLSQPESPPPPASDLKRIWLGIILILILLSARSLFSDDREKMNDSGERLEKIASALRITKYSYVTRAALIPQQTTAGPARRSQGPEPGKEAIEQWRKLTNSKFGRVTDWRRLGITQATFGQMQEGLKTLRKIADLPPALREGEPKTVKQKKRQRADDRVPWADLSPTEEVAFWQALYGPEPFPKADVSRHRATLEKLELNWFDHLVREQLYTRAGMTEEARRERAAALDTAQGVVAWTVWQSFLALVGIVGLAIFGARAWHTAHKQGQARDLSGKSNSPTSVPPPDSRDLFPYRARMLAFLAYFALPLLTIPVSVLLKSQTDTLPLNMLARLSVVLYLLVSALSILFSLWILRRMTQVERRYQPVLSWRETLTGLGLRAHSAGGEIGAGLLGHAMLMPLLLIVGFVSNLLFSRFKTPPHPVLFQFFTMNSPLDQGLLLLQTAVVAAVTEELMFRGVFYPALRARYGVTKAIALSAAVFSLAHPTLPGGFLPLWLLGAAFAFTYERRGSLLPSIIMHALNNGTLLLTQFATFAK